MSYSMLTHLECSQAGERHEADTVQQLSRAGAPLLARYDLSAVRAAVSPDTIAPRSPDLWRCQSCCRCATPRTSPASARA